jgi:tRNA pseudouridine38-40 synthase
MKRIKLEIAYDGTGYCGWQLQPQRPTVEGMINSALSQLLGEKILVTGASRTDAGVHAMGNVAVFDTESRIPAEKICPAVNQYLPQDIRVQNSSEVSLDFHPRRVNCRKTYQYRILNRKTAIPMERFYSDFVYYQLDLKAMQEAADYLVGEYDFKSFCSAKIPVKETVRIIYQLKVAKNQDIITLTVIGNGFLYNMVRIIAGTLIEVGRGAIAPEQMIGILNGFNRSLAGPTAPSHGLVLVDIVYEI